jgi:hypothetical protein
MDLAGMKRCEGEWSYLFDVSQCAERLSAKVLIWDHLPIPQAQTKRGACSDEALPACGAGGGASLWGRGKGRALTLTTFASHTSVTRLNAAQQCTRTNHCSISSSSRWSSTVTSSSAPPTHTLHSIAVISFTK